MQLKQDSTIRWPRPCQDRVLDLTTNTNLLFSISLSSEGTGLWKTEKCLKPACFYCSYWLRGLVEIVRKSRGVRRNTDILHVEPLRCAAPD